MGFFFLILLDGLFVYFIHFYCRHFVPPCVLFILGVRFRFRFGLPFFCWLLRNLSLTEKWRKKKPCCQNSQYVLLNRKKNQRMFLLCCFDVISDGLVAQTSLCFGDKYIQRKKTHFNRCDLFYSTANWHFSFSSSRRTLFQVFWFLIHISLFY